LAAQVFISRPLTQGLSAIPAVPEDVRAGVRARAAGVPAADLHPASCAAIRQPRRGLRPSDPQRILRALEVFEATGKSLVSFHATRTLPVLDAKDVFALFLATEERS